MVEVKDTKGLRREVMTHDSVLNLRYQVGARLSNWMDNLVTYTMYLGNTNNNIHDCSHATSM